MTSRGLALLRAMRGCGHTCIRVCSRRFAPRQGSVTLHSINNPSTAVCRKAEDPGKATCCTPAVRITCRAAAREHQRVQYRCCG